MKRQLSTLLKRGGLIIFGLLIGLVMLEIGLHLVPEEVLNLTINRYRSRFILYQPDPQIGWRHKPGASLRYTLAGEYDVQVQINSLGLNDVEHSYDKPPGTFRILLLGDSFADAVNVPISEGFPYQLEVCLNEYYHQPIEVINTGTSYYATAEELFFLQYEGLRYMPDLVLVAFFIGNDIDAYATRTSDDGWFDGLGGYLLSLDETGQLKKTWIDWQHPSPYDEVPAYQIFLRRYSKIYYLLAHPDSKVNRWGKKQLLEITASQFEEQHPKVDNFTDNLALMKYAPDFPHGPHHSQKISEAWAIIAQLFSQIQHLATTNNAAVGVLIIPERSQASEAYFQQAYQEYSNRYGSEIAHIAWDYTAPNKTLSHLLAQKDIPDLDLLPIYRAYDATHSSSLYFSQDIHLNHMGHRLTAVAACQWVIEHNFVTFRREKEVGTLWPPPGYTKVE